MKFLILLLSISAISVSLISCDLGPHAARGFSFPEGDVEKGKGVLAKYQCLACHQVKGITQPEGINNPDINVLLGGKSTKVKTYADLVTSVINPSHKIRKGYPLAVVSEYGKSKMTVFNDEMTVTELINLVTFLETQYELIPFTRTGYKPYPY